MKAANVPRTHCASVSHQDDLLGFLVSDARFSPMRLKGTSWRRITARSLSCDSLYVRTRVPRELSERDEASLVVYPATKERLAKHTEFSET